MNISIWLKTNFQMLMAFFHVNCIIYAWMFATGQVVSLFCKKMRTMTTCINGTTALLKTVQALNIPGLTKTKTGPLILGAGATIDAKLLEVTLKKNALTMELTVGRLAFSDKTTRTAFTHTLLNGIQKSNVISIVLLTVESWTSIIITCVNGTTSLNSFIEPDWPLSVFGQVFIQSNLAKL